MDERRVKRKIVRASKELKEKKDKERNVIIRGWREVLREGEVESEVEAAKEILGNRLKVKVRVEEVKCFGRDEGRKVLKLKLRTREDKREIMANKKKLRGTRVLMDEDLIREEREITQKMVVLKTKLKAGNRDRDVWVRGRSIKVDGKWYSWNEAKGRDRNFGA